MNVADRIDHTLLKPEATAIQVQNLVSEALRYGFAAVCVNGIYVREVAQLLRAEKTHTKCAATVGFPLGAMKPSAMANEAVAAVKDGAGEIDFVAHLPFLLKQDVGSAKAAFMEVVKAARSTNSRVVIKVIVETGLLMKDVSADEAEARIEAACRAVRESGCDFIKTSTGFMAWDGATVEAVKLLKKHSHGLYVKAAGGIRSFEDAVQMIEAGADRLGCSAGVQIVKGEKGTDAY